MGERKSMRVRDEKPVGMGTHMINDTVIALHEEVLQESSSRTTPTSIFSHGSVTGIVEVLFRKERKFLLYDAFFQQPVTCYFDPIQEELVRDMWGKQVVVAGYVGRDSQTGRALVIQNIRTIECVLEVPVQSYKEARGIFPWVPGDESSVDAIRRVRDAC